MSEQKSDSLQSLFAQANETRTSLDDLEGPSSEQYQAKVKSALSLYEEVSTLVDKASLFSPNESIGDVSTKSLLFMLVPYWIAELILKVTGGSRKQHLQSARKSYETFLKLLDSYDMLSAKESELFNSFVDSRDTFSISSTSDAASRRELKIARFKEEKKLKQMLEFLQQRSADDSVDDDENLRELQLADVAFRAHQTFQSLESIAQELQILKLAPQQEENPPNADRSDPRHQRDRDPDSYSDRLDGSLPGLQSGSRAGPILSKDGKPLRPFTLLDNRQRLQQGVFRPDHNLPTMTIDEYLEEERRRGGIIEGGGAASALRPEPDEDDIQKADEETMKARDWDEFKEANPRGSGNTLNRG